MKTLIKTYWFKIVFVFRTSIYSKAAWDSRPVMFKALFQSGIVNYSGSPSNPNLWLKQNHAAVQQIIVLVYSF